MEIAVLKKWSHVFCLGFAQENQLKEQNFYGLVIYSLAVSISSQLQFPVISIHIRQSEKWYKHDNRLVY